MCVHHESGGAPGLDHQEGLGVILGRQDREAEIFLGVELGDLLDVGGPGGRDHGLALEVLELIRACRTFSTRSGWP